MRRPTRGFTLIELMVVMAIVGILSSVAIPSYRTYQLRTKQAERAIITKAMKTAVDEYLTRQDRLPNGDNSYSWLTGPYSPSWPPQPHKRPFQMTGDWTRLNMTIVGHVYYSYYLYANLQAGGYRDTYVVRYGDLDADRQYNYSYEEWYGYPTLVGGRRITYETYYNYDDWVWSKTF